MALTGRTGKFDFVNEDPCEKLLDCRQQKNSSRSRRMQGCQIFLVPKYPNEENYTKLPQNVPNGHKIFPMAVK
jgi:hypothetical protein